MGARRALGTSAGVEERAVSAALALVGWTLAICGLMFAALLCYRGLSYAKAVARACHEVRGPLTAISLGLDLAIRSGHLPDERIRALDLELGRAALALDDLSAAWQTRHLLVQSMSVERECIDVRQLLSDSVEALRGAAAARGVELRLLNLGPGAVVAGERLRLAQATGNLIANAIEHGGGVVDISWRVDRSTIRIEVVDEGVGLPAGVDALVSRSARRRASWDWADRLVQPRAITRRGHGLAIASAVAAAHGGRLASAPSERGARLVLELPSVEAELLTTPAG